MRKGCAIVISAPSGAGKSTLCRMLLAEFSNLRFSISCATRPPRPGEIDGEDYYFISREEFIARRDKGEFAEWAAVHGQLYGTPIAPLKEMLENGRDALLDVDVQGAAQIRGNMPEAYFIFILPPSMAELENRLRKRGANSEESVVSRMKTARLELYQACWYNALVINDDLSEAYACLRSAYIAATMAPDKRIDALNSLLFEGSGQWPS